MQQDNRNNSTGIQAEAKDKSKVNVAKTINIYESSHNGSDTFRKKSLALNQQ
jgi:hypothetical protein